MTLIFPLHSHVTSTYRYKTHNIHVNELSYTANYATKFTSRTLHCRKLCKQSKGAYQSDKLD